MTPLDDLSTHADRLRTVVAASKNAVPGIDWYPYDSFASVTQIRRLLDSRQHPVLESALSKGVLDVGCGDGQMSFLFESLGCRVTAIDNPVTNHSGMRGVGALKKQLQSSIEIREIDVDSQFDIPPGAYGLSLMLGTLYHLKNPFHALEVLSRASQYCILSTRIARKLPGGAPLPAGMPLSYLLDAYELNDDESNYWIFSEDGLQRLLRRSSWEICAYFTVGDTRHSDPVSLAHDERAFCLLRSHYGLGHLRLTSGWYEPEQSGWRWTRKEFNLTLTRDAHQTYRRMSIHVFVPDAVLEQLGAVTLSATVDGSALQPAIFDRPGNHVIHRPVNLSGPTTTEHLFLFSLDKSLNQGRSDQRELGIIVSSIEFD